MKAPVRALVATSVLLLLVSCAAGRQLGRGGRQHKGRKFSFTSDGGAAKVLAQLERASPHNRVTRAAQKLGRDKLAEMLDTDGDLGIDLDNEVLIFQCQGVKNSPTDIGIGGEQLLPGDVDPLADQAFQLSSRPTATIKIWLDFNGGTVTGSAWNTQFGNFIIPPYDKDGDTSSFSDIERNDIVAIWRAVSEDYAIFDVDITTVKPAPFQGNLHVMIGGDLAWYGGGYPGGVAFVGQFGDAYYSPIFVAPLNLGPNNAKYVWEAVSHEVGHTLGLFHDGVTGGNTYFYGQGDWAPIMGTGYFKQLTQFDRGEYPNSNQPQDDIAVISSTLPLLPQDNAELANAKALDVTVSGATATGKATGTVVQPGVPMFFSFEANAGTAVLTVEVPPPYKSYYARSNLDIELRLYDAAGTTMKTFSPDGVSSSNGLGVSGASVTLPSAGKYYLSVMGVGAGDPKTEGYSTYGSRGQFAITAIAPAVGYVAPQPSPSPEPQPEAYQTSPSPLPEVQNPPTVKVSDIQLTRACNARTGCTCSAKVYVVDAATLRPVNYATVLGTWTSVPAAWAPYPATAITGNKGYARFAGQRQTPVSTTGSCTFAVTSINSRGYIFDSTSSRLTATLGLPAMKKRASNP